MNTIKINDRIINLDRVSNISVRPLDYHVEEMSRITFNFDFTVDVSVRGGFKKAQPYLYIDVPTEKIKDFYNTIDRLSDERNIPILYLNGNNTSENNIINLNKCSSVHFDDNRENIIFNMSSGVEKDGRLVTDFKYMYFDDSVSYNATVEIVRKLMNAVEI